MAFGKPAILDPKFDLRAIQAAIRAARQRIEVAKAAVAQAVYGVADDGCVRGQAWRARGIGEHAIDRAQDRRDAAK